MDGKRRAVGRWLKRCLAALVLVAAVYILGNALAIWLYADVDETAAADVAVVLGAGASDIEVSPVFQERLNHACWLYQEGYVKKLLLTGGYGEGNLHSDAYVAGEYLQACGIPQEDILLEEASAITEENLKNAKAILEAGGYGDALIVSDPLHMKRAMRMAQDFGFDARPSPTTTSRYRSLKTRLGFLARETFLYIGYKWARPFRLE